jgi:integrase
MTLSVPISDAKSTLSELMREAEVQDVVLLRHGRPTAVAYLHRALPGPAGVPHHRLYDSRHTPASLLLAQGVYPRVVMEVLGHSSFARNMATAQSTTSELPFSGGEGGI